MNYELDDSQLRLIRWALEVAKQATNTSESLSSEEKIKIYSALDDLLQEKFK